MKRQWLKLLLACLMIGSLALAGCSGDDGDTGATGPEGPAGSPGLGLEANETCTVCHMEDRVADVADFHGLNDSPASMTVSSVVLTNIGGFPNLAFSVSDGTDSITDLTFANFRFYIAELVPGLARDPDAWDRWAYERSSTDPGTFTNLGDGDYNYLFSTPFADAPDAANVQRLAARITGVTDTNNKNFFHDFLIADPATVVASGRDIVSIDSCNECHDPLAMHGGGYVDTKLCVVCHNPNYGTMLADGADFTTLIHQIHSAIEGVEFDWTEITYPQDTLNCAKCHSGPDGDNWNTKPNMIACSSCHVDIDFNNHPNTGDVQADNSACAGCHTVAAIKESHLTPNATEYNPDLLDGQREITYDLQSAVISGTDLVISFNIESDGTPLDLTALPADLTAAGNRPSFLLAYAMAQDGIAEPADFNNLGNRLSQPTSLALSAVTLECSADPCTATVANPFPAGATMRTVGLQGYFRQDLDGNLTADVSLHTQSDVVTVTGDTARRQIADSVGCAECHEIFEGHGGNRVFTTNGGVQICTLCHAPNLSSSGRSINPAAAEARPSNAYTQLGGDTVNWPVATNNFKDMIHGIHSAMSDVRTEDYDFVRGRNDGIYYNWSEVTYPGTLNNCEKCHLGETYRPENIPAGALVSTDSITTGEADETFSDVSAAMNTVPNATDEVISPLAATCYACHTAEAVVDHMKLNGAAFGERSDVTGQ